MAVFPASAAPGALRWKFRLRQNLVVAAAKRADVNGFHGDLLPPRIIVLRSIYWLLHGSQLIRLHAPLVFRGVNDAFVVSITDYCVIVKLVISGLSCASNFAGSAVRTEIPMDSRTPVYTLLRQLWAGFNNRGMNHPATTYLWIIACIAGHTGDF